MSEREIEMFRTPPASVSKQKHRDGVRQSSFQIVNGEIGFSVDEWIDDFKEGTPGRIRGK